MTKQQEAEHLQHYYKRCKDKNTTSVTNIMSLYKTFECGLNIFPVIKQVLPDTLFSKNVSGTIKLKILDVLFRDYYKVHD